jgi:hypothetical protein
MLLPHFVSFGGGGGQRTRSHLADWWWRRSSHTGDWWWPTLLSHFAHVGLRVELQGSKIVFGWREE